VPLSPVDLAELSPEEVRVLGCLAEKELTTPQSYPLTLNALVLACNQSHNREPVVAYDERTVEQAVTRAKTRGLARFVHPSHGRSAIRYRHELAEQLGVDRRQLALLAVLMLRGPQTAGELRARTERMGRFDTLAEVEAELDALARRPTPLVARLARQPGRKEDRFAALLGPPAAGLPAAGGVLAPAAATVRGPEPPAAGGAGDDRSGALRAEVETLRAEVEALQAEVEALGRDLDDLRRKVQTE
jgi:uncharacterized protein YceH (UPF0502 family)